MKRVLVVCTVHRPSRAAVGELCSLVQRLRPEVIFLEHSAEEFESFRDGSCGTLEAFAVKRYLEKHHARLVPVDLDSRATEPPLAPLKSRLDTMFDDLASVSPRLQALEASRAHWMERCGFAYLNGPIGWAHEIEHRAELARALPLVSDPETVALYNDWARVHDRREHAMIDGVEDFARSAAFNTGVMLVGAAHRERLLAIVQARAARADATVEWDFEWALDDMGEAAPAASAAPPAAPLSQPPGSR